MRLDKLAITAQEAFQNSMGVASDAESAVIQPIHLLKALLDADENNLAAIIKRIGADPAQLERNVNEEVERGPKSQGGMPMPMPGNDLMKTIDNAVKAAEKLGDSYATSEHLLIALSEDKGPAGRILNGAGITRKNIEAAYEELRGDTRVTDQQEKAQFEALEQYGQNLTQQAREGKLDPVIGRSEEIRRTIQVLSRRTKNNPVLIGEPGTGKTAIVEGLAQRIVAGDVPSSLKDRDIVSLDVTPAALEHLSIDGFDPVYGARPLKRLIQREVVDRIADAAVRGKLLDRSHVLIDIDDTAGDYTCRVEAPLDLDAVPVE